MTLKKTLVWTCFAALAALLGVSASAQPAGGPPARGKAEMKAGTGSITIDYGRPSLKGRDMLSQLKDGGFWRMGMNEATVLTTPVDLTFGSTKIAKGAYSLWLKKAGDAFQLVFNSQTGQWGTQHDTAKDVTSVEMKETPLTSPVETFTIELAPSAKGDMLDLSWGAMKLTAPFHVAK
jgi:hypothetical protein